MPEESVEDWIDRQHHLVWNVWSMRNQLKRRWFGDKVVRELTPTPWDHVNNSFAWKMSDPQWVSE